MNGLIIKLSSVIVEIFRLMDCPDTYIMIMTLIALYGRVYLATNECSYAH